MNGPRNWLPAFESALLSLSQAVYRARNRLVREVCQRNGLDNREGFRQRIRKWSQVREDRKDDSDKFRYYHEAEEDVTPELRWRDAYAMNPEKVCI